MKINQVWRSLSTFPNSAFVTDKEENNKNNTHIFVALSHGLRESRYACLPIQLKIAYRKAVRQVVRLGQPNDTHTFKLDTNTPSNNGILISINVLLKVKRLVRKTRRLSDGDPTCKATNLTESFPALNLLHYYLLSIT